MTTNDYLNAVKQRLFIESDYGLSKVLLCTRSAISRYRSRGAFLCDDMAIKVAKLLEIPAGQVLADVAAERTKCPAARMAWHQAAKLLSGVSASIFIGVFVMFATPPTTAEAAQTVENNAHAVYHVKLKDHTKKSINLNFCRFRSILSIFSLKNNFHLFSRRPLFCYQ